MEIEAYEEGDELVITIDGETTRVPLMLVRSWPDDEDSDTQRPGEERDRPTKV